MDKQIDNLMVRAALRNGLDSIDRDLPGIWKRHGGKWLTRPLIFTGLLAVFFRLLLLHAIFRLLWHLGGVLGGWLSA